MREFKFRIWNEEDAVMVDKPNSVRLIDGKLLCDPEDILMQYTGLKDKKNKKEIYEGDIVVNHFSNGRIEGPFLIEWGEDRWMWGPFSQLAKALGWYSTEVIGNIYENPELIEKSE